MLIIGGEVRLFTRRYFNAAKKRDAPDWERQPSDAIAGGVDPRIYEGIVIVNCDVAPRV